ncbi:MAG: N-acetylglucosamine-6-phosphate deacetylase [Clostridia bacterium]|nr:N-acetylglucosamine-6-phosphate deacetylase [Clostridia bacterium]MBQ8720300.1 N-acetylglucosamine-6-phosphate deacetylase [Clostridia bacterium]
MSMRIKSDKIVLADSVFDGYVYIENGVISDITTECREARESYDFTGKYLSAGFIELHTHGGGGYSFADSSADEVADGCNFQARHGVTSILPTISTSAFLDMKRSLENIAEVMKRGLAQNNVIGAHLEGPYLSLEQCGAQYPENITEPKEREYRALVEDLGGYIKRWTYAPERDTGAAFCTFLTENGIIASPGHTSATYTDMIAAVGAGASLVTHLYSCTSTVTRKAGFRSLGVIESAYLLDDLFVEIIADGKHLPPELINMIVKIKGRDRVALVTDSLSVAGTAVTSGNLCGTDFIVEDGVARLPDRSAFVGSVATADTLVRTLTLSCDISLVDAVYMLTSTPAKILGLNKGEIAVGKDADFAVFDADISVSAVFVMGKKIV